MRWPFYLRGASVRKLLLDEAGCTGVLPSATSDIQPAFVISALLVEQRHLSPITKEFIHLKRSFFPGKFTHILHDLDAMTVEIKGSDLRGDIRNGTRRKRDHAYRFIDEIFRLLEKYQVKICARIWIKGVGASFNGRSVYTITTQRVAQAFQDYLATQNLSGVMIGDFRQPKSNSYISHSVFTQKYKAKSGGDPYPRILEVPTFGISDNHACLQITDILTSAVIYPMATFTYCTGVVKSVHVNPSDQYIKQRYKKRIKNMQYTYTVGPHQHFGVSVSDAHHGRTSWAMFN